MDLGLRLSCFSHNFNQYVILQRVREVEREEKENRQGNTGAFDKVVHYFHMYSDRDGGFPLQKDN